MPSLLSAPPTFRGRLGSLVVRAAVVGGVLAGALLPPTATAGAQRAGAPITLGSGSIRRGPCVTTVPHGQQVPAAVVPGPRRVPTMPPPEYDAPTPEGDDGRADAADALDGAVREESHDVPATAAAKCTQMWITATPGTIQVGLRNGSCLAGLCVNGIKPGSRTARIHVDTGGIPAKGIPIRVTVRAATHLDGLGGGHNHLQNKTGATGWLDKAAGITDDKGNFDLTFTAGMRGGVEVIVASAAVPNIGTLETGASVLIGMPQAPLIDFFAKTEAAGPGSRLRAVYPTGMSKTGMHWSNHWVQPYIYNYMHEFFAEVAKLSRLRAEPGVYGPADIYIPVNDISLAHGGRFEVRPQGGGQECSSPLPHLTALGVTPGPSALTVSAPVSHQAHDRGIDFDVGFCTVPRGAAYINGATCIPCVGGPGASPCRPDWAAAKPRAIQKRTMDEAVANINKRYPDHITMTVLIEGDHYHVRAVPKGRTVPPYLKQ